MGHEERSKPGMSADLKSLGITVLVILASWCGAILTADGGEG